MPTNNKKPRIPKRSKVYKSVLNLAKKLKINPDEYKKKFTKVARVGGGVKNDEKSRSRGQVQVQVQGNGGGGEGGGGGGVGVGEKQ